MGGGNSIHSGSLHPHTVISRPSRRRRNGRPTPPRRVRTVAEPREPRVPGATNVRIERTSSKPSRSDCASNAAIPGTTERPLSSVTPARFAVSSNSLRLANELTLFRQVDIMKALHNSLAHQGRRLPLIRTGAVDDHSRASERSFDRNNVVQVGRREGDTRIDEIPASRLPARDDQMNVCIGEQVVNEEPAEETVATIDNNFERLSRRSRHRRILIICATPDTHY